MRIMIVIAALAAGILFNLPVSYSAEKQWCSQGMGSNFGAPRCEYVTFEECRLEIVAGNRGFCNQSPRWVAEVEKRHGRKTHVHRD
jgi:hypothetical protein